MSTKEENKLENILKWKLGERPTTDSLCKLVEAGIISKEDAKKIVLETGAVSLADLEAVKAELGLMRKMVLELSEKVGNPQTIVRIIEREVPIYIRKNPHYWDNYYMWCSNQGSTWADNTMKSLGMRIQDSGTGHQIAQSTNDIINQFLTQ